MTPEKEQEQWEPVVIPRGGLVQLPEPGDETETYLPLSHLLELLESDEVVEAVMRVKLDELSRRAIGTSRAFETEYRRVLQPVLQATKQAIERKVNDE